MNKCEKCSYEDSNNLKRFDKLLCKICAQFSPDNKEDFEKYINEKLDWQTLESFRKFQTNKNFIGMEKKVKQGNVISRAPFGYKIENKKLVLDLGKKLKVQKIFMDFLEKDISLNKLSKEHGFSVNGIKKILRNFTNIGKVKFNGQILQGNHEPIISSELFNKVQNKLEGLGIK
ncbi:MAG: recombinase family protein [Nanoarchaeota archaeon]|nr:recombinase family protein [Nanoarchaeota archaeon]